MADGAEFRERPWPCKLRCALLDAVAEPPALLRLLDRWIGCSPLRVYYLVVRSALPLTPLAMLPQTSSIRLYDIGDCDARSRASAFVSSRSTLARILRLVCTYQKAFDSQLAKV